MKKLLLIHIILCGLLLIACSCEKDNDGPTQDPLTDVGTTMQKSAKRGVAFAFNRTDDLVLMASSISWDYNWGAAPWDLAADYFDATGVEFCPMCWNQNYNVSLITSYVSLHPSTKYLLGFNEPNLTDQANMTPQKAAQYWPGVVRLAKKLNLKLVAPAMNYGTLSGYSDPIKWLDEFFAHDSVSIDDIGALSLHCYMSDPAAVRGFISRFDKYKKPIWLTEFCAWESGTSAYSQVRYMSEMLNFLEKDSRIQRYSWFIPRYKTVGTYPYMQLLTDSNPSDWTDAGLVYSHFSSFDRSVYLDLSKSVNASQYVDMSGNDIYLHPSSNHAGQLAIQGFSMGQWTEYQVYAPEAKPLKISYSSYGDAQLIIMVDGSMLEMLSLPKTGSTTSWSTVSTSNAISMGRHTLRLMIAEGSTNLEQIAL